MRRLSPPCRRSRRRQTTTLSLARRRITRRSESGGNLPTFEHIMAEPGKSIRRNRRKEIISVAVNLTRLPFEASYVHFRLRYNRPRNIRSVKTIQNTFYLFYEITRTPFPVRSASNSSFFLDRRINQTFGSLTGMKNSAPRREDIRATFSQA